MKGLVTLLLASCTTPQARSFDDASSSADAVVDAPLPDMFGTDVIVGERTIVWSRGRFPCSLEFGCERMPTITTWSRTHHVVENGEDSNGGGSVSIAGTDDELFYSFGDDGARYIRRNETALSIPRGWVSSPAIDATYVYWFDGDSAVHRASRDGNGSDGTIIGTVDSISARVVYAAGYLWWVDAVGLHRIAVDNGVPALVMSNVTYVAAIDDAVYVARESEVGRVDVDTTYHAIATHPGMAHYFVGDGDSLAWATQYGVFMAPRSGGGATKIYEDDTSIVALLPSEILVDFTRYGFRTVAR